MERLPEKRDGGGGWQDRRACLGKAQSQRASWRRRSQQRPKLAQAQGKAAPSCSELWGESLRHRTNTVLPEGPRREPRPREQPRRCPILVPSGTDNWLLALCVPTPAPAPRGPRPGELSPSQLPCCLGVTPQGPQLLPLQQDPPALRLPSTSKAGTQQVLNVCGPLRE